MYLSQVNPERIENLILNRLDNRGFFYSKATSQIDSSKSFAKVKYTAELPKPYTMETFQLQKDSLQIYGDIAATIDERAFKKGERLI